MRARHGLLVVVFSLALGLAGLATVGSRADDEPQPTPSPSPAAPEAAPPPSVTIIAPREAHGVLGRDVRSPTNEDMGHIVDVIVDRAGVVRAAVIDFGGFLGVGSRKIVVDWNALHFGGVADKSDSITLELTKAQVAAAPEYKEDKPIVVLGAAGNLQPLDER
jgi:hypothetical protein